MNVIWHDDPCLHPIIASVRFQQNLFNEFGDVSLPKPAIAMTAIQPCFKPPAFHGIIRLFQNRFKLRETRDRKGSVKLKRNELCHVGRIEVR